MLCLGDNGKGATIHQGFLIAPGLPCKQRHARKDASSSRVCHGAPTSLDLEFRIFYNSPWFYIATDDQENKEVAYSVSAKEEQGDLNNINGSLQMSKNRKDVKQETWRPLRPLTRYTLDSPRAANPLGVSLTRRATKNLGHNTSRDTGRGERTSQ